MKHFYSMCMSVLLCTTYGTHAGRGPSKNLKRLFGQMLLRKQYHNTKEPKLKATNTNGESQPALQLLHDAQAPSTTEQLIKKDNE